MLLEFNKIYNEDCLNTMNRMEDNTIDCVITSPPYDNIRNYNGYKFDFCNIVQISEDLCLCADGSASWLCSGYDSNRKIWYLSCDQPRIL